MAEICFGTVLSEIASQDYCEAIRHSNVEATLDLRMEVPRGLAHARRLRC